MDEGADCANASEEADATNCVVDESAFWHVNMDLYYGYVPGEVVEIEHEPQKYWLAYVAYSFKQLVLLRWIGEYDEFWIDTSQTKADEILCSTSKFNPKRIFPPAFHKTSLAKANYELVWPTKVLEKPSLYIPSKDPYAEIETIDDLLDLDEDDDEKHEAVANCNQTDQANLVANNPVESNSLLTKRITKVKYGQEDVDEVEAALLNLNETEKEPSERVATPEENKTQESIVEEHVDQLAQSVCAKENEERDLVEIEPERKDSKKESSEDIWRLLSFRLHDKSLRQSCHRRYYSLLACEQLIDSTERYQYYTGIDLKSGLKSNKIFFVKPKQFYDAGGANQERVFVPGTLLEVCHKTTNSQDDASQSCAIASWFAFVVKNIGGRLLLRWFFCDKPKFMQGRLLLKTCNSRYIKEEEYSDIEDNSEDNSESDKVKKNDSKMGAISSKELTFSLHYCDPRVHSIGHAKSIDRPYTLPTCIESHICKMGLGMILSAKISAHCEQIFDPRRKNLDRDRPLIDHILSFAHNVSSPIYNDIIFAPQDKKSKRDILFTCPKMTKLFRGFVRSELEPGVFEIQSYQTEGCDIIRFVYPYDNSYTILPTDWSVNNEDCLSIDPSRNASPTTVAADSEVDSSQKPADDGGGDKLPEEDQSDKERVNEPPTDAAETEPVSQVVAEPPSPRCPPIEELSWELPSQLNCLKSLRPMFPRPGDSFRVGTKDLRLVDMLKSRNENLDLSYSEFWTTVRAKELEAPSFHFCIDTTLRELVECKFKIMDSLEVAVPSSDFTICTGRIRKIAYPLLWIQISPEFYTVLAFNSTNIYPSGWCASNEHPIVSLLPPRKRCLAQSNLSDSSKKRKKTKSTPICGQENTDLVGNCDIYEKEHFDLGALNDRQSDIDYIISEKSAYIKIFFNHKCFTGPSLSKSKICSLPQYVGPGPLRLVMEEVMTKIISVAYVPPRILNDLSSGSFEELLIARDLTNITQMEFKAKYQKRVHRENIPVCLSPDDVSLYCECVCDYIKCCYNLFGPTLYDGDDCPGHCRVLTKSNKFMKRALYYREKARQGEYLSSGNSNNSSSSNNNNNSHSNNNNNSAGIDTGSSEFSQLIKCKERLCPENWSVDDVSTYLEMCQLAMFKTHMKLEGVDGQALLLLDRSSIREHFQQAKFNYSCDDLNRLCRFVEFINMIASISV